MRKRPIAAVALAVFMTVPAGAQSADLAPPDTSERVRVLGPDRYKTPELQALRPPSVPGHITVDELLARRRMGLRLPGAGHTPEHHRARAAADAEGSRGTYAYPISLSDIDGDTRADITTWQVAFTRDEHGEVTDREVRYAARRGTDGALLWITEPIEGTSVYERIADVDADGVPDIIAFDDGGYVDYWREFIAEARSIELDQRVFVLSGATGRELWSWSETARIDFVASRFGHFVVRSAKNLMTDVQPFHLDPSRERGEVVIGTSDFEDFSTWNFYALGDSKGFAVEASRCTSTAYVLDGGDGDLRHRVIARDRDACGMFLPMRDRSGDGVGDLVFYSGKELELRSADGVHTYWTRRLAGDDSFSWIERAPLESGASEDILLLAWNFYVTSEGQWIVFTFKADHLAGYSGRTGETLFDHHFEDYFNLAGSIDEDGGLDFFDVEFSWDRDVVGRAAYSGRTGALLWERIEYAPEGEYVFQWSLGDVDGDGSYDLLTAIVRYEDRRYASGDLDLRSGTTASSIWKMDDVVDHEDIPDGLWGDVDGDGAADIATYRTAGDGALVTTMNGVSRRPFWSMLVPEREDSFWFVFEVADLTPAFGRELLVMRFGSDGESDTTVWFEAYGSRGSEWSISVADDFS